MVYIKIEALPNGAHENQQGGGYPGEGWAVIPEEMEIPASFPFVSITAENGIVTEMTAAEMPEPGIDPAAEVARLKAELSESDYKVIKCAEAQLAGLELPYNIQELHAERQVIRDRINELEAV